MSILAKRLMYLESLRPGALVEHLIRALAAELIAESA
jgi:hypothetical protein